MSEKVHVFMSTFNTGHIGKINSGIRNEHLVVSDIGTIAVGEGAERINEEGGKADAHSGLSML